MRESWWMFRWRILEVGDVWYRHIYLYYKWLATARVQATHIVTSLITNLPSLVKAKSIGLGVPECNTGRILLNQFQYGPLQLKKNSSNTGCTFWPFVKSSEHGVGNLPMCISYSVHQQTRLPLWSQYIHSARSVGHVVNVGSSSLPCWKMFQLRQRPQILN